MAGPDMLIRENESKEELGNTNLNKQEQNALTVVKKEAETAGIKQESKTATAYKMNDIVKNHFSFYQKNFNSSTGNFDESENISTRNTIDWVDQKYLTNDKTLKNVDVRFVETKDGTFSGINYDADKGVKKDNLKISDITKGATKKLDTKDLQVIRNGEKIAVTDAETFAFKKGDLLGYTTNEKKLSDVMQYSGKEPPKFDILRDGKVVSAMKSKTDAKKFVYVSDPTKEVFLQNNDKVLKVSDQVENIEKNMELFYQGLMKDLWAQYDALNYKTDGEDKINNILNLAVYFINTFSSDKANVRNENATVQQKEETFKTALRGMEIIDKNVGERITSDIQNDAEMKKNGYKYVETTYKTEKGAETPTDDFYRLSMADVGKEALDANFKALRDILDKPGVVILGYDVVGYASTVPYNGTQTINLPSGGTFDIKKDANGSSNSTLSQGRMMLAEDWLKNNYKDKLEAGYISNKNFKVDAGKDEGVDYNDPAHPEYKQRGAIKEAGGAGAAEATKNLNDKFGEFQGVDIKVNYRIDKQTPQYIYEKGAAIKGKESWNNQPKAEVLVMDGSGSNPKQFEVSGRKLDQDKPLVAGSNVNEATTWKMKFNDMRVDAKASGAGGNCVVSKKYQEYVNYSKEDPTNYPPISDPKTNNSWIDKMDWTNSMTYGTGEQVSSTPIFNLDLSNATHKTIYEEMQKIGFGTEKGITTSMTDKQLQEYIEKWTKMYVKDGIKSREKK